jgi:hypothetical protein
MISTVELIIDLFFLSLYYLIIPGFALVMFIYHFKRKFRSKLFNFKKSFPVTMFVFFMAFFLIMSVMFASKLLHTGDFYHYLMATGVPAKAKVFYSGFDPYGMVLEVGVEFLSSSGEELKHYVVVDPVNYTRLFNIQSLRIHYQDDDPAEIILDDFPPCLNPFDFIILFSSILLLITGAFMWTRRDYVCPRCRELHINVNIRTPHDLRKVLKMVHRHVVNGTVSVLHDRTPTSAPFNRINPDGPWKEELEYLFRCNTCWKEFGLSSITFSTDDVSFAGAGGRWSPK